MTYSNTTPEEIAKFKAALMDELNNSIPAAPAPPAVCRYAEFTDEPYLLNRPCKGKKIICRRDNHPTHRGQCNPACRLFEELTVDPSSLRYDGTSS